MLGTSGLADSTAPPNRGRLARAIVLGEPQRLRGARRILQAVAEESCAARRLRELPGQGCDVIVADYASLPERDRELLLEGGDNEDGAPSVLWQLDAPDDAAARRLFAHGARHILRGEGPWAPSDLRATLRKLAGRELFGADKYLGWGGREWNVLARASADKDAVLQLCQEVTAELSLGARRAEQLEILAEELLTNALYNAPVDTKRRALHAARARTDTIELARESAVEVSLATDGERLALAVADPFGSLHPALPARYLAKCLDRRGDQMDHKPGGAGLGFYYAYKSVSSLIINLSPGRRTEVIGLIELLGPAGGVDRAAHAFSLFVEQEGSP